MMSHDAFCREKDYLIAVKILKSLWEKHLLTDEEYASAKQALIEKNKPVVGKLIV